MAVVCPTCKSSDMQAQLNTYQCLHCGRITSMETINQQTQEAVQQQPAE